jgi:hypothetical protein
LYLDVDHALFFAAFVDRKVKELNGLTGPPLPVLVVVVEAEQVAGHRGHDHVASLPVDLVRKLVDLVELGKAFTLNKEEENLRYRS